MNLARFRSPLLIALTIAICGLIVMYARPDAAASVPRVEALRTHAERFPELSLNMPHGRYEPDARRSVFAFREPPPAVAPRHALTVAHTAAVVAPVTIAPPPPAQPAGPQPPELTMRCIGRFGTDESPLAAFSSDGEVVTARAGETIHGKFIIRAIGRESVEIGFVGFAETTRIPIGGR